MMSHTPVPEIDTPWRSDPAVKLAAEREQLAATKAAELDHEYRRLWADAISEMDADHVRVLPGHDNFNPGGSRRKPIKS